MTYLKKPKIEKPSYRSKNITAFPYAKIDWSKAKELFQKPPIEKPNRLRPPKVSTILHMLGSAGVTGLTFLFEAGKTSVLESTKGEFSYRAWQTRQKLKQLAKEKFVEITKNQNSSITVKITKHGLVKALSYELDTMNLEKPKHWDAKWRVVIFDVPEKESYLRDLFRMRLKQLGLYQLQKSVYISPYACFNEIEFLRELYGVPFTVKYMLVEKIEDDGFLKIHFGLN